MRSQVFIECLLHDRHCTSLETSRYETDLHVPFAAPNEGLINCLGKGRSLCLTCLTFSAGQDILTILTGKACEETVANLFIARSCAACSKSPTALPSFGIRAVSVTKEEGRLRKRKKTRYKPRDTYMQQIPVSRFPAALCGTSGAKQ